MNGFRPRQLWFACVPFLGWALFAALLADDRAADSSRASATDATDRPRTLALGLDIAFGFALATFLPPALAWILAITYWLVRDAGGGRWSLGRRIAGDRSNTGRYTESYFRNVPMVLPVIGPVVELVLLARGSRRMGDRLTRVFS